MANEKTQVILRLGAHSEKEYFLKLAGHYDAVLLGANLLEISRGATSSLLLSLKSPFYLDPYTYTFGPYFDPDLGRQRNDLEWIKSTQTDRKTKRQFRAIKRSYVRVAQELGAPFTAAVDAETTIDLSRLDDTHERTQLCAHVIDYQRTRLSRIISEDEEMNALELDRPLVPAAVFAPYFYIAREWASEGIERSLKLARTSTELSQDLPVHMMLCISREVLGDEAIMSRLASGIPKTGVSGVWLWFSKLDELSASLEDLTSFRRLVSQLGSSLEVFNRHGGMFSLMLRSDGLRGISHGVGYGERKGVVQVIAPAAPTIRYYLPAIGKRVGVAEIQRCFSNLEIDTPAKFFESVCDCTICQGVLQHDFDRFGLFGEMHRASTKAKRDSQTASAAKMCRYHFLLNRFRERERLAGLDTTQCAADLRERAAAWRDEPTLRGQVAHLNRWDAVLTSRVRPYTVTV